MRVGPVVLLLCALYTAATALSKDAEIMDAYKNPEIWKALVSRVTSETPDEVVTQSVKSAGFQSREAVRTYKIQWRSKYNL